MRKLISSLGITTVITGLLIAGCQSSGERFEVAQGKAFSQEHDNNAVKAANRDVLQDESNAQRTIFLRMTEAKIKSNESLIAALKEKKKSSEGSVEGISWASIDSLEMKNTEMKTAKEVYEKSQNDGASFQRDINLTLVELTKALKNPY